MVVAVGEEAEGVVQVLGVQHRAHRLSLQLPILASPRVRVLNASCYCATVHLCRP